MTQTMTHGDLADGIEPLVREYISTIRIAAQGAVVDVRQGSTEREREAAPGGGHVASAGGHG